jgi:hypothetical protein
MKKLLFLMVLSLCFVGSAPVSGLEVFYWMPGGMPAPGAEGLGTIPGMKDALTCVSLHSSVADGQGGFAQYTGNPKAYVDHYHQYGVKVVFGILNCEYADWDWYGLAKPSYTTYKDKFIDNIMDHIQEHGFDGVDIDFEGGGPSIDGYEFQNERVAFAEFVKELGTRLHDEGKELGICCFHSPCWNAPNMAWFKDWVGYVDHARTMGYADDYEANQTDVLTIGGTCWGLPPGDPDLVQPGYFFKYSWKSEYVARTTGDTTMLSIGIGGDGGPYWGGKSATEHVRDIANNPIPAGIAMWNYNPADATWGSAEFWAECKKIHDFEYGKQTSAGTAQKPQLKQKRNISVSRNAIHVSFDKAGDYAITMYDPAGRAIMHVPQKRYESGSFSVPMADWAAGVRLIKVTGKNVNTEAIVRME